MTPIRGALRWALLAGLYLVLAGETETAELVAAALAGAAAMALSLLLRYAAERHFRLGAPRGRIALKLPWALLRDSHRVMLALLKASIARHSGAVVRQPFPRMGEGATSAGHRALGVLLASLAPNGYVLAEEKDALLIHRLAPAPPSADRVWPI